ncbi:HAMP domain-containing sensor histidine kinase [Paenibacillus sediminis]|uniref:histidine kinase n=1 Tax=Paenibacillus sediminis TaxID=664909 RepID=A0ABS4H2R4_9BACL|nr:HAMP domain-containing sensor histidine kinase [Paenibacillus sediminis]MBP1936813.1 signal transduction histidine kinase [Paenibacillus sediminis]
MRKLPAWMKILLGIIFWVGGITATVSAAFLLTSFIYRNIDYHPSNYVTQLINTLIGCILMFILLVCFVLYHRPKQMALIDMITGAMKQIAKGDFSVHLGNKSQFPDEYSEVVDNLNMMAHELKQIEDMRQEFISNVSHEIQSPLTSINGFAQALQSDQLSSEERQHYLSIIETESKRLSKLSDNLLKLTSLDSEHHPFDPKPYSLDGQLRSIVLASEPQWLDKSIDVELRLVETNIVADEEMLSQVWNNLIHNSIKFTPIGGTITIAIEPHDNKVTVSIADTGIGISEEDQTRIFERFFKGDKSRNRSIGGSGLGLSIVKKIIDKHHGTIEVDSRLGEGTRFRVHLPLKQETRH